MKYVIEDIGNGWYDFKNIPQGYVKINGLNCGDDEDAIKYGQKLIEKAGIENAELVIEEV